MGRIIQMKLEEIKSGNWDSSISVVTRRWDERLRNHCSISGKGKNFFASHKLADWLWPHPGSCSVCVVGSECIELWCHYTVFAVVRVHS